MEADEETNGEGRNTEENADNDEKEGNTEDDRKTTITTGGRKEEGIGNEVKAPSGQEDPATTKRRMRVWSRKKRRQRKKQLQKEQYRGGG